VAVSSQAVLRVGDLGELPVVTVRIEELHGSDSPRLGGEDLRHLRVLADMESPLPPIIVHRASMRVVDGMHRLRAARLRGEDQVQARFVDCDEASCFVLAVEANIAHGLPLSLADRKAAASRIIGCYPQWSDRRIASVAGIAARTVAALRPCPTVDPQHSDDIRIGRDGRARPLDSAQRRAAVGRLLAGNPGASLREIARQAGVSPQTVSDVRSQGRIRPMQGRRGDPCRHPPRSAANGQLEDPPNAAEPVRNGRAPALSVLMADPAIRSTDIGRALLRMLNTSGAITRYGAQIQREVPNYSLPVIAEAALACSQAWHDFADSIQRSSQPER
jgi:ParB-like nuclease domain/Homeodomain-like domain